MSINTGPNIITDGLVLNLDAANNKSYAGSGNTWYDLTGNNNNGLLVNTTTFSTIANGGIILDDGNEYIRIEPSQKLLNYFSTNNFSIQTIVRSDNVTYPRSRHPIYVNGTVVNNSTPGWSAGHQSSSTSMQIISGDGVNRQVTNIDHNVIQSVIYHRVFTINRTNGTLTKYYVNGSYIGEADHSNVTGSIYNGTTTDFQTGFVFGYVWGWRYIGAVFNISVYNRTLSLQEIQQNFNAIKSRFNI